MVEIVAGVAVVAIVALFLIYINRQYEMWAAEKRDLMNRIMARDYGQYVEANIKTLEADAKAHQTMEVISSEELEHRITEQTAGIPV